MGLGNNKKTEDYLAAFSLKSPPVGLKEKIFEEVRKKQSAKRTMTPFLRRGLAGCLLLLISIVAIDGVITQAQNKRFSSFIQKGENSALLTEEEQALVEDIIGELSSSTKNEATMNLYKLLEQNKKRRRQTDGRESLGKEIE